MTLGSDIIRTIFKGLVVFRMQDVYKDYLPKLKKKSRNNGCLKPCNVIPISFGHQSSLMSSPESTHFPAIDHDEKHNIT